MPPKQPRRKNTKFKKTSKETLVQFVARVVNSIGKAVTVEEVWNRISSQTKDNYGKHKRAHKRTKALDKLKVGATLSYAAKKEMISKKKCGKNVCYMPNGITEDVSGEEIPIPKFSKSDYTKTPLEAIDEAVKEAQQILRKKNDPKFQPMNHSDAFQPLEDEKKKQRQRLGIDNPSGLGSLFDDNNKLPNEHGLSFIEVAALYYGVTIERIERIVLFALHAVPTNGYPSLHLRQVLHKELGQ